MRGVFGTGVLDGFLTQKFNPFDFYIGVSAGATNIAAYLAENPRRNLRVYSDYSCRPEFINLWRYLRGGHFMDLDWLWDITVAEEPLSLERIYSWNRPFILVLTDVETGRAVYVDTHEGNLVHVMKASSTVPGFYRGFLPVEGRSMADGGVADSIPVAEAIRREATKIMVIRSRTQSYRKKDTMAGLVARWIFRRYPAFRDTALNRASAYNASVDLIRNPPDGVKIIEVCPPDSYPVDRLTRNPGHLHTGYKQGFEMAGSVITEWNAG